MLSGWIKIHREILDHWVSSEPELLAVWIRLIAEANYKTTKSLFNGSLIEIKRGQLIFGLNAFSDKSKVSIAKLRRYLKLLESDGMISRQIASKYSIITITFYEEYQSIDSQDAGSQQADDSQDAGSQQADDSQDAGSQQHRKKAKKDNNEKKGNKYRWQDHQLPEWIPTDAWLAWMNQRLKQKAINSERALNGLLKNLTACVDAGYDATECIDLAIQRPWKSIELEWLANTSLKRKCNGTSKAESEFDEKDYTKGATDGFLADL